MTETSSPAWAPVAALLEGAPFPVEILPPSADAASDAEALRLGAGSTLGEVVLRTGGLLLDNGWVRLLGSSSERLHRSLLSWNVDQGVLGAGRRAGLLIVGDDVLGGVIAINGGALGPDPGMIYYFGPDTLHWDSLNCDYTALLHFLIGPGMAAFYSDHRWLGWEAETAALAGDGAHFVHPPLWAVGPAVGERHRGAVPMTEMLATHAKALPQLHKQSPDLFPSLA